VDDGRVGLIAGEHVEELAHLVDAAVERILREADQAARLHDLAADDADGVLTVTRCGKGYDLSVLPEEDEFPSGQLRVL